MSQMPGASSSSDAGSPNPFRSKEAGSFSPPADYVFEPEFEAPVPRPVPSATRHGRYALKRRKAIYVLLWIGIFALLLAPLRFVKEVGKYFTPCEYLRWIGYGALLSAGVVFVKRFAIAGPYRYIREGTPLVARVLSLVKAPTLMVEGQPTADAILAIIEFRNPDSGQLQTAEVKSTHFSSSVRAEYTTSFKVGDYVTAVYLHGDLARSLRLYSFLDLMPDVGLIRRNDRQTRGAYVWKIPVLVLVGIAFFGILFWDIIAFGRYEPLNFGFSQGLIPFTAGAIVLGGGFFGGIWFVRQKEARRRAERNAAALAAREPLEVDPGSAWGRSGIRAWAFTLLLAFGGALLGGGTSLCWCFTFNALLDRSPARNQPVQITEMLVTTHNFLFREYTLKFALQGENESHRLLTSPDHLDAFRGNAGMAEIHAGRLGWPWVKTIHPLNRAPEE